MSNKKKDNKNEKRILLSIEEEVKELHEKKENLQGKLFKGVYLFASFDLVNSTKIKYRDKKWLRLIDELVKIANNEWFGLRFWKFNGDEILYYAKVDGINQLARILLRLNDKSDYLKDKLLKVLSNDDSLGFTRDLVGIKTAVWIAYVSNEDECYNTELTTVDSVDFAGINMDEGFRMSKCVIQNKIIVDPKIAFLICLAAKKIMNRHNDKNALIFQSNNFDKKQLKTLDDIFSYFWNKHNQDNAINNRSLYSDVANKFRIINYESCKGVWDDRPYPIIWYSDNWGETLSNVKYDELYLGQRVTKDFISSKYDPKKESYECTCDMLSKIYDDVSAFKTIIDKILLESNFSCWTEAQMDKQYTAKTYLYYSVVCIHKKTHGVLVFKRHPERGHLANVWDFDQRKPAQLVDGGTDVTQIQNGFYENYGIRIKVVLDQNRSSLLPIDIHPIYRRKKIHHGILCFAYIEDDIDANEVLNLIRERLPNIRSSYGYPLYSDVEFVYGKDICEHNSVIIRDTNVLEITYDDILSDSESWDNHNKGENMINRCVPHFSLTIRDALRHIRRDSYVPDGFFMKRYLSEDK